MKTPHRGARWLRWLLWLIGSLFTLILIAWLGLSWYVHSHKQEILTKITQTLGKELNGDIQISDMKPGLIRSFPDFTLILTDVSIRDSLWKQHHHELFQAKELEVRVNAIELLKRRTDIGKVKALHGSIFLYTDSTGYSNTYLLARKKDSAKAAQRAPTVLRNFSLEDIHFWFVNDVKEKLFHIELKSLDGEMNEIADLLRIRVDGDAQVHEFNFNRSRGSYLHNQSLGINLILQFHRNEKRLEIEDQIVRIGGTPVTFGGNFFFDRKPAAFDLKFQNSSVKYKTATAWLSPNISKKLNDFDFEKPIALEARISGTMQYRGVPKVRIKYQIRDNKLTAKFGEISGLSYDGTFTNEALPAVGPSDENSQLTMLGVKANWYDIPFECDTVVLDNLLRPYVKAHIKSSFPVKSLNDQVDDDVIVFKEGQAVCDVKYAGGIVSTDKTPRTLDGFVQLKDISFRYVPRNMDVENTRATLMFRGDDLLLRDVHVKRGQSSLDMEGEALHLLRFYFADPGRVAINWKLRSPMINVGDFLNFAANRQSAPSGRKIKRTVSKIGQQLRTVMAQCLVHLDARIDKLVFKKFTADGVVALVDLTPGLLQLQQLKIINGAGSINLTGRLNEGVKENPFTLKMNVQDADVVRLFRSFDNFGQDGIKAENLKGNIDGDIELAGYVYQGQITRNSMKGTIHFDWQDGALINFEPLEKIGKFVFKKRNLSHVDIKSLKGNFFVEGEKIKIPPMLVQTSVVNMNIQGVYGLKGGTDIFMAIPLRNPEKKEATSDIGKFLNKKMVVYLRVQNEKGDNLKVAWDPGKKGEKSTEEKLNTKEQPKYHQKSIGPTE